MFRTSPVHLQERFLQAVCADLVCGNTRTTRHVQPLARHVSDLTGPSSGAFHKLYLQIGTN